MRVALCELELDIRFHISDGHNPGSVSTYPHNPAASEVDGDNYIDDHELTASQKSEAIDIVLNDTIIKRMLYQPGLTYSIGKVSTSNSDDVSGYIGDVPRLASVPIMIKGGSTGETMNMTINNITHPIGRWRLDTNLTAYVDIDHFKVASVSGHDLGVKQISVNGTAISIPMPPPGSYYNYDPMPRSAIIPPGSSWYHRLDSWWPNYNISVSFEPKDARIYAVLLNETGFEEYRNGSTYHALTYLDRSSNKTYTLDGSNAIQFGWNGNIAINNEDVYILFKNAGESEARVNVTF